MPYQALLIFIIFTGLMAVWVEKIVNEFYLAYFYFYLWYGFKNKGALKSFGQPIMRALMKATIQLLNLYYGIN
ncbi:MAG: hypothetical protein AAGB13_14385, partial [Cyanobacteria bacterium P01_F01_bin.33]